MEESEELAGRLERFREEGRDEHGGKWTERTRLTPEQFYAKARNESGQTLLHVLCEEYFCEEEAPTHVALALACGADPNAQDTCQRTPLHEISDLAWGGEAEAAVIDLLLRAGARIDAQDWMGRTPLFAACYKMGTEEFAPPIAEHLINRGAAVNLANADGFVPLLLAVARGDVALAQLLVSRGASPYVRTTGTRQLYNGKTLLIDNHDGVEIPVGTRPIDLATSGAMCGALTFPY